MMKAKTIAFVTDDPDYIYFQLQLAMSFVYVPKRVFSTPEAADAFRDRGAALQSQAQMSGSGCA